MGTVAENLLDAVDILVDGKLSKLQYNKTIRGRIAECIDDSIGQYKIQYQNSYFTAYTSDSSAKYQKGSEVYVEILSGDFEKNALILGTVQRLGSNYISIIERLDRYTDVGVPVGSGSAELGFCSYDEGEQTQIVWEENQDVFTNLEIYFDRNNSLDIRHGARDNLINVLTNGETYSSEYYSFNKQDISEYAAAADTIKISMDIKTALSVEQRLGSGNYGLRVYTLYYDEGYIDHNNSELLQRIYTFDINDMTGQPYRYTSTTNQYGLYPIDGQNFLGIYKVEAFCENFPKHAVDRPDDIFLSNFDFQFLKQLTEEELNTTSLNITTPYGGYFNTNRTKLTLHADLRIRGKKVNYDTQPVDFYWFRKNAAVRTGHEKFSVYGGNGWECLNKIKKAPNGDELEFTEFIVGKQNLEITSDICPTEETEFKCIAIYKDNNTSVSLTNKTIIKNYLNTVKLSIVSDTGTLFSFNIGKTILHLTGVKELEEGQSYKYYWSQSIQGGAAQLLDDNDENLEVEIATPAATYLSYDCSVYLCDDESEVFAGSASIILLNNKESLGSTLVINNGTQIFKYDGYGVAPSSNSLAEADRMVIPVLSFDIYDKEGKLINISDDEKPRKMSIRWIWPVVYEQDTSVTDYYKLKKTNSTMLTTNEDLRTVQVPDIANGSRSKSITVLDQQATFTYNIENRYNAVLANTEAARNNIILEVDYQGEHLVASTNFTFTKEGELGTNGTKYVARIVPAAGYKDIFILNNQLCARTESGIQVLETPGLITNYFQAQLWDGGSEPVNLQDAAVAWNVASSSARAAKNMRLTISQNNVTINSGNDLNDRIVIQVTIPYKQLKYYATYAIPVVTSSDDKILWLADGYSEVMYESDGSRGKFNGLAFEPVFLTSVGYENITQIISDGEDCWDISWGATPKREENTINRFKIEPPDYYIGEEYNQYIKFTYDGYSILKPIELYLNRYGMSAMNDWDGSSIQISEDGGYILSPQVGAGQKEDDNSFTGITIGTTFQDNRNNPTWQIDNKPEQVGMFGYFHGQRSLFLDAKTGDAEFGVASEGQIKIRASDGQGTISDGHYHYNHEVQYDPDNPNEQPDAGRGLKIKFTSTKKDDKDENDEQGPYIKYGSGNFSVNAAGHLIARGGGTIAGWNITDDFLASEDGYTKLYADNGPSEALDENDNSAAYLGRKWSDTRKLRFDINNRFKIDEDGAIKSTAGIIGGWRIGEHTLFAKDKKLVLNDEGSIWGPAESGLTSLYKEVGTINADPTNSNTSTYTITLVAEQIADNYISYTPDSTIQYYETYTENDTTKIKLYDSAEDDSEIPVNAVYIGEFSSQPSSITVTNFKPKTKTCVRKGSSTTYYIYKTNNTWETKTGSKAPSGYQLIGSLPSNASRPSGKIITAELTLKSGLYGEYELLSSTQNYIYDNGQWSSTNSTENKKQIGILQTLTNLNTTPLEFTQDQFDLAPNYGYVKLDNSNNYYYQDQNHSWKKLNNFSPNNRIWEITNQGVAYLTDVKIRNSPGTTAQDEGSNIFQWRGRETTSAGAETYPVIFELTDTGSTLGGWQIEKNNLRSGNVVIDSSNANTSLPVISIGTALQLYGNGDISSGGGANFSGSGSIGGCSFGGGQFNCPAGVLHFGGVEVVLDDVKNISDVDLEVTISNNGNSSYSVNGEISDSGGGQCSSSLTVSIPKKVMSISIKTSYNNLKVLKTIDNGSGTYEHHYGGLALNY